MFFNVPFGELAWLAAAVILAGVVTGILAGLFGIGGGAVIVPALYEVFRILGVPEKVRMQLCIGTSLAIIVPTTIRSYRAHRERGEGIREVVRLWAAPAVVGVAVGAALAALAPGVVFKIAFVVIVSLIAIKLLFGGEVWRIADELPGRAAMTFYGFLVGLASSLLGISGGSVSNTILMLYGRSIHNAVAISSGLGVPIAMAGTVGYALAGLRYQSELPPLSIGFVSIIGLVLMAPVSSFVAAYGARLAHALSRRNLEIAFGLFLLAIAIRFALTLGD
ncbi:MAG: sulfite exporter TauE/SafE family protein [Bradyrhizobiaceae bacterium]|nr:sulfite exporter TauE/SafE family protein [Hyphomicrobiales bacterium]MBV9427645.1 sulfite exporter TauE/SafE family protein [Bradyrhizobiaceae bacterium]